MTAKQKVTHWLKVTTMAKPTAIQTPMGIVMVISTAIETVKMKEKLMGTHSPMETEKAKQKVILTPKETMRVRLKVMR